MEKLKSFARFAWAVLFVNVVVVLLGAFVRATGSGAGCGSHWPLCQGEVIPRMPQIETVIEFTHRLGSGLALILVLILFFWAWKISPKRHPVRLGAACSPAAG
jgi:heme A synthase